MSNDGMPVVNAWRSIETAPMDGTPVLLFARAKSANASVRIVGWYHPGLGWIEAAFVPNAPVGLVPTLWQPLPGMPS